jgi:glyoxylase-like metal-dependent hydrolase (beta-lactamase superfamily II)
MRPLATPSGMVCHVLLVETGTGLVLVDSGLGLRDAAAPSQRFGPSRRFFRPVFDADEAAINQVRALGFRAEDVRDIVLTHFDVDHAGGIADFPWARVHIAAGETAAMAHPRTRIERMRYRSAQRAHHPLLVEHCPARGEPWRGFSAAQELVDVSPDLVLISLPGHSRGHAAIAVNAGSRWVIHVGDAFYHHAQLEGVGRAPRPLTVFERLVAVDWRAVEDNHRRLAELWRAADPQLTLVNAHDPVLLRRAQAV